jgi:hypothetical protein
MNSGLITYTFGEKYFLQCVVFLSSLRRNYSGKVNVFVKENELTQEKINIYKDYGVNIKFIDNENYTFQSIKPHLVTVSDFEYTFVFDTDILVRTNIDDLFEKNKNSFCICESNLKIRDFKYIGKQISRLGYNHKEFADKTYRNIGVVGFKKDRIFFEYKNIVENCSNKCDAVDEIVFNILSNEDNTEFIGSEYNTLHFINEEKEGKIIHFAWKTHLVKKKNNLFKNKLFLKYIQEYNQEINSIKEKYKNYNFDLSFFE